MHTRTRASLAATLLAGVATASLAVLPSLAGATEQDPPTKAVQFADLDLANPAGAATLYHRLQSAARDVCRLPYSSDKHLIARQHACIDKAVDDAVRSVNSTLLTEMRFGKSIRLARQ